jgi:glycogenin
LVLSLQRQTIEDGCGILRDSSGASRLRLQIAPAFGKGMLPEGVPALKTYVTLLSTPDYLPGVLVLSESLRQVGAVMPLLVLVSADIPKADESLLLARGIRTSRLTDRFSLPESIRLKAGHWAGTLDKLQLFGLTDYQKLVYLDSDMMILTNIDELFECPHMSAVAAGQLVHSSWSRLNSGLMVIEPDGKLPAMLMGVLGKARSEVPKLGTEAIGDQDLINAFYDDWPSSPHLHLDQGYNVFHSLLDEYVRQGYALASKRGPSGQVVRVVHFIGRRKPWMKLALARQLVNTLRKPWATTWERRTFFMYRRILRATAHRPSVVD